MITNGECSFGDPPIKRIWLLEAVNSIKLTVTMIFDLFIAAFAYVSAVSRIVTKGAVAAHVLTRGYQQYH